MTSWILRNLKVLDPMFDETNSSFPNAATNTLIGGKNGPLDNASSNFRSCAAMQGSGIALLSFLGLLVVLSFPVYAQDSPGIENEEKQLEPLGNVSDSTDQEDIGLNTTTSDIPVLEKLTDNGTYKVQLRWGQPPSLLAENGFDMEIVFLNASSPPRHLKHSQQQKQMRLELQQRWEQLGIPIPR